MKKYTILIAILLVCSFILMACSNDSKNANEESQNNDMERNGGSEEEGKLTSDPIEVITDDSYHVFKNGMAEMEIIGRYASDESDENGMVTLEKNGFKVQFALVHDPVVDEKLMYVMGERENTNEDGGMMGIPESDIKTNQQEILEDGFTTGDIEPGAKDTFANTIFLNGEPFDSFEIIFKEPIDKDVNRNDEHVKDWKRLEFYRE